MNKIEVRIMRLPHAADLPLPAYHSAHAAGFDLVAAVQAAAPVIIAPVGVPQSRPVSRSHYPQELKDRSGRGPGWRCITASQCSILRVTSIPITAAKFM